MLAHIYIGTIGMEGAFEAMGTGEVDVNWAKEHHSLWLEEELSGARPGQRHSASGRRPSKPFPICEFRRPAAMPGALFLAGKALL